MRSSLTFLWPVRGKLLSSWKSLISHIHRSCPWSNAHRTAPTLPEFPKHLPIKTIFPYFAPHLLFPPPPGAVHCREEERKKNFFKPLNWVLSASASPVLWDGTRLESSLSLALMLLDITWPRGCVPSACKKRWKYGVESILILVIESSLARSPPPVCQLSRVFFAAAAVQCPWRVLQFSEREVE